MVCFDGRAVTRAICRHRVGHLIRPPKGILRALDDVMDNKVSKVIITCKDRLSRVGFDMFHHLFTQFRMEIVMISEVGNLKLDSEEVFEEIVSLLHCYSIKL